MGVSRSPAELRRKLDRLADEYEDLPMAVVKEGSQVVKKTVLVRTPDRLSGRGKRGAKLGVRYNVAGYGDVAKSLIYATGPFHLIERDTKPHRIPALVGQKTRRDRAQRATRGRLYGPAFGGVKAKQQVIVIGGNVRASAFHPGTQGQHPWAKGVTAAAPLVRKLFEARGTLAIRRVF